MSIAIVLVAIALIGGTFLVATGRGGELARGTSEELARPDFESWTDIARYRPPPALLGYQPAATDHALHVISRLIAERDAEIAWLRERLREVQPERDPRALTGPDDADDSASEPEGRGAAWTEERSDEGRRRPEAPRGLSGQAQ